MSTLKTLTIVAALLAGGTSLALAQNGPATGGQSPVAGGANGGWYPGYGYGYGYPAAPLYSYAAPAYAAPLDLCSGVRSPGFPLRLLFIRLPGRQPRVGY
jgi:CubicO group peptidase (beta-lactamase class C family)